MSNITIRETALKDELEQLQQDAETAIRRVSSDAQRDQARGLILLGIGINRIAVIQELENLRREH